MDKPYYLFAFDAYHAHGGFNDFAGRFNTVDAARDYARIQLPGYLNI